MPENGTNFVRRAVGALLRRVPISRRLFRALDDLRAANAALSAERDRAIAMCETSERSRESAEEAQRQAVREREEAEAARWLAVRERDDAEAARWLAVRERDDAEAARWQAVRDREETEEARWQAVREREEAEKTRWAAVREREVAERARWAAVRQREEADAARRQAALGLKNTPMQEKAAPKLAFGSPASEGLQMITNPAAKLNGGSQSKVKPGEMKISIVLANYNHGAFITDCIEAVRGQTYANWELLIVDDGSTDDSRLIIQSLAQLDPRIVPIFLPENRGVFFAAQTGLAAATGELLHACAADDYIANDRFFELVVASLMKHPKAAGAFGKAVVIDASSSQELWRMGSAPVKGLIAPEQALESFLMGSLFVPGASAIWKRSLIDALAGFDQSLGPQMDFFINHALPATAGAIFIDEVFTVVRTSEGNYHRRGNEEDFFRRHALVEAKLRALNLPAPLDPTLLRIWRDRLINSRLAVTRQQHIYDSIRTALKSVQPWEKSSVPAEFVECSSRVLADIARLESDLGKRLASVNQVFDAFAGPIGLESEAPE